MNNKQEALLIGQDFSYHGFDSSEPFGDELIRGYKRMKGKMIKPFSCCNRYHLFVRSAKILRHIERMAGFKGMLNSRNAMTVSKQGRDVRGEFHGIIVILGEANPDRNCGTGLK